MVKGLGLGLGLRGLRDRVTARAIVRLRGYGVRVMVSVMARAMVR